MALAPNTDYVPANAAEIRDDYLADLALESAKYGTAIPVSPGTDAWIQGTAEANMAMLCFANYANTKPQLTPLYAVGQALEDWRLALGLPEVKATGATGKIKVSVAGSATVTVVKGLQGFLDNGYRGEATATTTGVADGDEVTVQMLTTGEASEAAPGASWRWANPPLNMAVDGTVSAAKPLTGGTDSEDDERKRTRILNKLRNQPAGGNWGDLRQISLDANGSIQDAYIYPALGGPASVKVAVSKAFDRSNRDYSRAPTSAVVTDARNAILGNITSGVDVYVVAVADQDLAATVQMTLPDAVSSGGNGQGWTDAIVWPDLVVADSGVVTISSVASGGQQITVSANTTTSPIAGQTHVAWFSHIDRKFRTYLVTAKSGSAGGWVLTLDRPAVDGSGAAVAVGQYISPAAANMATYGDTWVGVIEKLGPAENTSDVHRLPRADRHPLVANGLPSDVTVLALTALVNEHDEITDADFGYRSATTPTVPASVATSPNVFRPTHFGVYQK